MSCSPGLPILLLSVRFFWMYTIIENCGFQIRVWLVVQHCIMGNIALFFRIVLHTVPLFHSRGCWIYLGFLTTTLGTWTLTILAKHTHTFWLIHINLNIYLIEIHLIYFTQSRTPPWKTHNMHRAMNPYLVSWSEGPPFTSCVLGPLLSHPGAGLGLMGVVVDHLKPIPQSAIVAQFSSPSNLGFGGERQTLSPAPT